MKFPGRLEFEIDCETIVITNKRKDNLGLRRCTNKFNEMLIRLKARRTKPRSEQFDVTIARKKHTGIGLVALLAVPLLLLSCSKLDFFYNRLDWLIPHFVDDFVELSPAQEKLLDDKVELFIKWHCSEELPQYIRLVGQWREYADRGKLGSEEYKRQQQLVQERFWVLSKKMADQLRPLVQQLNDDQLQQFIEKIKKENQQIKEDFIDEALEKVQAHLESRLIERYERWIGSLEDSQLEWVRLASFKMIGYEKARYDYRVNWLAMLEREWQTDKNMDSVTDFLYLTVTDRERFWNKDYRLQYFNHKIENELLTLKIMNSLTAKQLEKLKLELAELQKQLEKLVCH